MVESSLRSLWPGRILALIAVVLISINLRTAVSSFSPIVDEIQQDIPLDGIAIGALGTLVPVGFAIAGLFSPWLARRLGLDLSLLLASVAMLLAHTARTFATDFAVFFASSAVALIAAGVGNVLLPPVIKRYFPHHIGLITAIYVGMLAISAAIAAAVAAPLAAIAGWRASLAIWIAVAACAAVPWLLMFLRHCKERAATARGDALLGLHGAMLPLRAIEGRLARSKVTWALTLGHGISSLNSYTVFAWLPALLMEMAGQTAVHAGALLALYSLIGLPVAVVVPLLVSRIRRPSLLFYFATAAFAVGYLGLLIAPAAAPLLWVVAIGTGPMLFAIVQVLLNMRTRDHVVTARVSGFVQGIGYVFAALGPLTFGVLHELTGAWTVPLMFLLAASLAASISGYLLRKPIMVDDELAAQAVTAPDARKNSLDDA
jgi:CP family cyanate transporter-like MFS transporter